MAKGISPWKFPWDFSGTEAPFEFTPFSRMNLMLFGAIFCSTDVDVPTNDLQLVDFTHIYSSFIGSNYIHVMAVIPELVQPARVRMCSGFQFENTNTKKNMLKGP